AVCLAYEFAFRWRLRLRDVVASLPMLAIAAAVGWYNLAGNPIHGGDFHGGSRLVSWLTSSVVVFRYLGNLFVPLGLSVLYDVPLRGSPLDPRVLAAFAGLAMI